MKARTNNKTVRMSLRTKNSLIFMGLFALLIAALWLMNHFLLEKYYRQQQLLSLKEIKSLLAEYYEDRENSELLLALSRKTERSGVSVLLLEETAPGLPPLILYSAGHEEYGLWQKLAGENNPSRTGVKVYEEDEDSFVYQAFDPVSGLEKINCLGRFKGADGSSAICLLSLSVARIAENAVLSNRFLLIMGALILLLGGLLVFFVSRRISDPIITLSGLSERMAALDFSEHFEGRSGDEIQLLGENINRLSANLKHTIQELQEANHRLEEDIREKDRAGQKRRELIASISHELKTPLTLIQGYAEGLKDGFCEDAESRDHYCDVIVDEAERMNRLVRQILNLEELESGLAEVSKSPFDMAAMMRDMSGHFAALGAGKDVRIEQDLPESLMVDSDESLAEQILQNYLSNALQYVKEGGLIRLSLKPREEGGALISVYNEGDPIPEEAMGQIWDQFYKVDKARSRSYGGSGLGLSIVKAAAERLGGGCAVENREEGVEFTAWI